MEIQCYLYRTASKNINRIRGREGGSYLNQRLPVQKKEELVKTVPHPLQILGLL